MPALSTPAAPMMEKKTEPAETTPPTRARTNATLNCSLIESSHALHKLHGSSTLATRRRGSGNDRRLQSGSRTSCLYERCAQYVAGPNQEVYRASPSPLSTHDGEFAAWHRCRR